MPIELQIKVLAGVFVLAVIYVCYQSWKLGRFMRGGKGQAGFSKIEITAWLIMLGYRLYGLLVGLTEQIEQLKAAGIIKEHLTRNQWINIGGNLLFITLMIISKQKELRAVRAAWASEAEENMKDEKDSAGTRNDTSTANSTTGGTGTGDGGSEGEETDRGIVGVGSAPGQNTGEGPPPAESGSGSGQPGS